MTTNYETDIKSPAMEASFAPERSSPCFSILRLKQDNNQPALPMTLRPSCLSLDKLQKDVV